MEDTLQWLLILAQTQAHIHAHLLTLFTVFNPSSRKIFKHFISESLGEIFHAMVVLHEKSMKRLQKVALEFFFSFFFSQTFEL